MDEYQKLNAIRQLLSGYDGLVNRDTILINVKSTEALKRWTKEMDELDIKLQAQNVLNKIAEIVNDQQNS